MSDWDLQALDANFANWRNERAPALPIDKAFERYAVEQVLKDQDLSDDEIEYGLIGGADDGGIDGMYFFVNRTLVQEETEVPDPALSVQLFILQSKNQNGFSEEAVEKMHTFTRDLLNYARPINDFTYYNTFVRERMSNFREKYTSILGSPHTLSIIFCYVSKSVSEPNPKVAKRVENLRTFVKTQLSAAQVQFDFWGCSRLLNVARTPPNRQMAIYISKHFTKDDGAVVCLVKLKSYAQFLTDEHGDLRKAVLEPNVRDYQGKRNPVNADIRATLSATDSKEFWWLNNGVTILASDCSIAGNKLTLRAPEVVNGLQTSQEIFSHFNDNGEKNDSRNILVRVIVPPDEQTRNKITKATNFQTPVDALSLHATDQIHFDIEERLKLYDLFYDRRKGEYKNLRKPISKIVPIRSLAQSIIAIVLQRPNDAHGGPQKLLKQDETYKQIFDDGNDRDLYVVCALLDRQVLNYLETQGLTREEKRDIRYYCDLWICCDLAGTSKPTVAQIAALKAVCVSPIAEQRLNDAKDAVLKKYKELGGTDKVAKGPNLRKKIVERLSDKFPKKSIAAKAG